MKRLIYLTYLGLLVLILISCQKETVLPEDAVVTETAPEARKSGPQGCRPYFFISKTGPVFLGPASPVLVMIGFGNKVSRNEKKKILSRQPAFQAIDSELPLEDGSFVTIVKLKKNSNCHTVENFMRQVLHQNSNKVLYALPSFGAAYTPSWLGLTKEFLVGLDSPNPAADIKRLTALTRTKIVYTFDDSFYILAADRNSRGDVLQMCTFFNAMPRVAFAEPNFVTQAPAVPLAKSLKFRPGSAAAVFANNRTLATSN